MNLSELVKISTLDTQRFGVITAKSDLIDEHNITSIIDFCLNSQVKLLIARCSVAQISTVHAMERQNFLLMDTLVYLKKDLTGYTASEYQSPAIIRLLKPDDTPQVVQVAQDAFTSYYGHYHADPRLDRQKAAEVYTSWAERCCTEPGVANCVLVAEIEGNIVGFRAVRMNSPRQGEFILAGVKPSARHMGIYRAFVIEGVNWCQAQGACEVINSTHLLNNAVQKTCTQLGFEPYQAFHTFHKWFI